MEGGLYCRSRIAEPVYLSGYLRHAYYDTPVVSECDCIVRGSKAETGKRALLYRPDSVGSGGGGNVIGGEMQVEYKKEWMDTYLWVLPDNKTEEPYIEQMLLHNQGEGRLEFSRQEKDGEEYYCYKVTGKKALNSIYAVLPIGERQIRGILGQLFTALENGREYLLCEEDFVLSPQYIFATFPQMEVEFCYVPGYGVPLRDQLEGLFEYLLNRVNYEDKSAVNLLYDCYMFCMKEKGGLAEMKRLLEKKVPEQEPLVTETVVHSPVPQPVPPKDKPIMKEKTQVKEKAASASYVSWLTDRLFHRGRREVPLVAEEREEYRAEPVMDNTVLLSAERKPSVPELICEETAEVIPLTKFPFYIGSAADYVDYQLPAEGVSRIHCCINKKEDRYYLSDLNSTNGTYLNFQEVLPGKERLLSANDEIRIISQNFYVKFPCH